MLYKCIDCGHIWGEEDESEGFSHGLCSPCAKKALIPFYRKEQKRYSGIPCFGTADGNCSQLNCKYREICLAKQEK